MFTTPVVNTVVPLIVVNLMRSKFDTLTEPETKEILALSGGVFPTIPIAVEYKEVVDIKSICPLYVVVVEDPEVIGNPVVI